MCPIPAANVSRVPQRSPLRYPEGKTWLIPHIRWWLGSLPSRPQVLVEPFLGGGVVSLTAVAEGLVERAIMVEIDREVAAFWHAAVNHGEELAEKVLSFTPTRESILALADPLPEGLVDRGFRALVLNRTQRNGIIAPGASLMRRGDNDRGVAHRWYPETLARRIRGIGGMSERLVFCESDAQRLLEAVGGVAGDRAAVFADPPYEHTGKRLYAHGEIDHPRLFKSLAESGVEFLATYNYSEGVMGWARHHGFHLSQVDMKGGRHHRIPELLVTRRPVFQGAETRLAFPG